MVESTALLKRHTRKGIGGSNPPLSAISTRGPACLRFLRSFHGRYAWCGEAGRFWSSTTGQNQGGSIRGPRRPTHPLPAILKSLTMKMRFPNSKRLAQRGLIFAAVLAGTAFGSSAADGPIAAVQTALIREQFLSGEPSGVLDSSTRGALRRFQLRHALPPTGEIDTATLVALQSNVESAEALAPAPPPAVVQSDREFLKRVERGEEQISVPAETSAATTRPAALAPPERPQPAGPETNSRNTSENPPVKPRFVTTREAAAPTRKSESKRTRQVDVASDPAARRPPAAIASAPTRDFDSENDPDVLGSHGTRIIRSTTTTTAPDGRTYLVEKTTTTSSGTPPPTVRRATAVHPRTKDQGFFHRIFGDD